MTKSEFVIFLMNDQGLSLKDAQAKADIQYGNAPNTNAAPLTQAQKDMMHVEEEWDNQVVKHEREAQTAVYPGQLRRIKRLCNEKLRMRKFFDRCKMYM